MPPKLVVAFPAYRQLSVTFFFHWLSMNHGPVVACVGIDGTSLPAAMRRLGALALREHPDLDRMVVFEQDIIPPLDAFTRIAQYGDEYDIVGTFTFRHEAPHHVMAMMRVDRPDGKIAGFSPITADVTRNMVEHPGLYEVDAVAMGFTSIHRRVLERWDPQVPMWRAQPPLEGHDLHFCTEAKKQGFKVWVDSGIRCGHLTPMPIGFEDSQRVLADWSPEPELWL